MTKIEIHETIVNPTADGGHVVQLHISDVGPHDERAGFRLVLLATLPEPGSIAPPLAYLQYQAMEAAHTALEPMIRALVAEVRSRPDGSRWSSLTPTNAM